MVVMASPNPINDARVFAARSMTKTYQMDEVKAHALRGVDFEFGEVIHRTQLTGGARV